MISCKLPTIAVAVCLMIAMNSDDAAGQDPAGDAKMCQGLWSGSWGGGGRNGVVYQPVIAELLIEGEQIELSGFPAVGKFTGTVRFDAAAKRMRIAPAATGRGQPAPRAIEFTYELNGDVLTLVDSDKTSIPLQRLHVVTTPLANAEVELVTASGINEAGDLLVTEFRMLRAGRAGATYLQPVNRSLSTRQATVLLVQDDGLDNSTIDAARRLIRKPTPVVITYRQADRPPPDQLHDLWKEAGAPSPDSRAVRQTLARLLRPGTLIFVLSASENVPKP